MKRQLFTGKHIFLAVFSLLTFSPLFAVNRYSVASGNWNSTSTWSASSGGASGASVPVAGDDVYIERGYTVTVTANAACTNIIFSGAGADAALVINSSVTLTASGTITLRNVATASNSCSISGSGSLTCASIVLGNTDPTNNATYTHTFNSSLASFAVSGNLSINSYVGNNTNRIANGVFSLTAGTLSIGGSVATANENAVNASTFTMGAGAQAGTLYFSGATPFSLSGTGTNTITLAGTSTLVNYSRSGAQTVQPVTYTNLTLSGSGAKTTTNSTVNGILSLEGTSTTAGSAPSYGSASTLQYKGSSSQSTGTELPATFNGTGGIVINNSSGVTLTSSLTISNGLTLTNGSFSAGANTLTLNGPTISGTPSNLVTTSSTNLVFGGSSSGVAVPSSVSNLRNLTLNNANGISMNSDITLATNGVLTLTSGILQAGTYTLNITNTASAAVVYTLGSFVNVSTGYLQRSLPSGLSGTGNNFLFPIGESNVYKAINLVDVNTGTTGPSLKASVTATGALTGDNETIGPVDPRYWSLINTNSGNFTSSKIELYESSLDATKTIGMSAAVSGNYSSVGGSLNASSLTSAQVSNPGPYFCVGTLWVLTFYSYQTGNWNDPATWTLDPSGTLQVGSTVPADHDRVYILSGRTVTLTSDVTGQNMEITIEAGGFLNQSTFRFTNTLTLFQGQGTLLLASVNFPAASSNTFINQGGGTTEYTNSADFTLPSSQSTYNNLTINSPSHIATQLSNLVLNGNFYIKTGTFRINNNTSTTKLSLTINGNTTIDNGASFTVGNGVTNTTIGGTGGTAPFLNYYLNFHTVIIKGDFTNNGTVKFTNLTYPLYAAFPPTTAGSTSGAATVYFQGESNNSLTCGGPTTFYNLVLNKGTDQTYKLTINSSAYGNFRIFGANISTTDGAVTGNPALRKALWIYSGSLILKGSLIIPSLSEGTAANADYYIPSNGALIIDGVDVVVLSTADDYREVNIAYTVTAPDNTTIGVTKGGYSSVDVFGKLQMNNGFLSARESGGIITSSLASGQIVINGGTIDSKQFLSSTGSAAYTQSGGLLILRGRFQRTPSAYTSISNLTDVSSGTLNTSRATNGTSSGYGSFNLENSANIYTVSGGTIRIYDVCGIAAGEQEAFDVKSSSSNINVTGGTLELIPVTGSTLADATSYLVNSSASIYNISINRTSSSSVIGLSSALSVQNTFALTAGSLASNNNNLTVGGNMSFESGTTYTPGSNTTILNGSTAQVVTINQDTPLSFNALTINKPAGVTATLAGSQNTLNITGAFNLTAATLNDAGKTINISGSTIYNSGVHSGTGVMVLNGTSAQTIDGNGTFQNITLNNNAGPAAPVSLLAGMTVNGALTFSQDKLFNIGTYNLLLNSSASIVNSGSTRYIQTAGNAGDGGLTRVYSSATSFTFPVGAPTITPARAVKYTPATIGFSSDPSAFGSVTVIPVGYEHPLTTVNGQSLTYYWRVKSSGFSGIPLYSVVHSFNYDQTDVVGTESGYVPSLYDQVTHSWYTGTTSNINTTSNTISDWTSPTNSTNFLDGDYTAGQGTSFGTPVIFYSRQSGLWSTLATWSLTSHTSNNPPASPPGANDIVIIGGNDSIYLSNEPALPTNNTDPAASFYQLNKAVVNCANLKIEAGSVLDIQNNPGCTFASVLSHSNGNGKIRLTTRNTTFDNPSSFVFPSGDFSDFNTNNGISEFYSVNPQSGTYYILPSNANTYGNVILTPWMGSNIILPNISNVSIHGDLICNGSNADAWLAMSWSGTAYGTIVTKSVTVGGDLKVLGGSFIFIYNGSTLQQISIAGDVYVSPGAGIDVQTTSTVNSMSIGGSLYNNSNNSVAPYGTYSQVRFLNGSNKCSVTFNGSTSSVLSNNPSLSTTPVTIFSTVTVNKGTSQTTTLDWTIGGTLTTPSDNWLTLQNGTLIYDRTGNFNISQGTNFTIPATACLRINTSSNVYLANNAANNKTLFLDGRLTILNGGGTVYVGPANNTANNADIEYSGSGASAIEVQGGNLIITGQVRRPAASTNGILSYRQTGGNVVIYGNNPTLTKAKLEVINDGSEFTMSGGTLSIVQGGGTTFGDLYLRPATGSVTGGTINFTQSPPVGPVIDAVQSYHLDANVPLYNLTVTGKPSGPARNATVTLMISPLALNGNLTLTNSNSIFVSNNLNLSLKGDLNNNGTYTFGTNTTLFNGNIQSITGSSVTNFYDLTVSSSTSLTVNNSFTVSRNLSITTGNFILSSYRVNLSGNLVNDGSYSDNNSTGGITLSGSGQQYVSGTGQFGLLELNNSAGARITSDINLQNNLVMSQGILDISLFELTLNQNSQILGSPFGLTKMIKSDGVINCPGVKKFFTASAQNFTFPVGVTGKYTPVTYAITANASVGFIRINPININHPGVTDPSNVLKYYWQVESSGISGFDATALFKYVVADVQGTESNYIAAWLERPANVWHKALTGPSTDNVNETTHEITFVNSSSSSLTGDYTAGIDAAIPGVVPSYQTIKDGNWSDVSVWTPVGTSPPCPAGGPNGAIVIINHVVTTDVNKIYVFSTVINNRLRVVSPTYGHNLGYVSGNGTLYLESGNLPGGNFSDFTSCSYNGTLEYGGTGTYTIIATLFSNLPNISFTGTGTRILPNKDLSICKKLIINGPALDNSINNRKLTIMGTMERYGTGTFLSGTGNAPSATVVFAGTSAQTLGGPTGNFTGTNGFNNIEINNLSGLTIGASGSVEVGNQLILTSGIITTSATSTLTVTNTSSSAVTPSGGSSSSFISGPLSKYIINGDAFIFPLGKGTTKGHTFTLTSTAGSTTSFTAEFFTPNTTATSVLAPIKMTNTAEYWNVSSISSASAKIKIAWDPQSDLTPLVTTNGLSDMRVSEFVSPSWTELASTTTGDSYNGDVATVNSVSLSTTAKSYTTASISGTLARASFGSGGSVCGTTSGIQVSFTSFDPINLNYTIGYTINGVTQTPVTVTSLPYILPTPSAGTYKLSSFLYNNGSGTGVVDATTVVVYTNPTTSNAGSDQSLCGVSTTSLAGNNPSPYAGLWTIVSGTGGSVINSSQNNSVFNGILGNAYTLQWTISNGPCTSSDNVIISFPVVASTPGDFTSGPATGCRGTTGNLYTIPNVPGVTYTWTYSGTGHTINGTGNSVTVDFSTSATSGTLSVTATNNCGTSPARTLAITVPVTDFSYAGSPFCQNSPSPSPVLAPDGVAGTFSSTAGLIFISTSTGQLDLASSSPGLYNVTNIANVAGCPLPLTSTAPVTISGLTWTGAISNDWNLPGNWSCGFVPYPTTHTVIPDVANKPVLSSGSSGSVNNITIDAGSLLSVTGNTLKVAGTISSNAGITSSGGTIEMSGTSAQSIPAGAFAANTLENLTINNTSGVTLLGTLNITGILKVQTGSFSSAGYLTLISSASGTALIDGSGNGSVTGNVTMQRYLPSAFGYKYISSPFQSSTVNELSNEIDLASSFPSLYMYDESRISSGWTSYIAPASTLNPLQGYAAYFGYSALPVTADITGVVNNGILSTTLYNHNNTFTKGFNLVGNPYPSPIDWNAASGWTKTNIDNALYYFKASTTDDYGGTYSTYINGVSSDGQVSSVIPSMQGFFVHVSDGAYPVTGTLSMDNSVRTTDQSHPFTKSAEESSVSLIRLRSCFSDDTISTDPVVIYFTDKATSGFDGELDALKLYNTDYYAPSFYAMGADGSRLSIDALPPVSDSLSRIPLGISIERDGNMTFSLKYISPDLSDIRISITDTEKGTEQDLENGGKYSTDLSYGEYTSRFYLNLRTTSTGIPEVPVQNELFTVYCSHGTLKFSFNLDQGRKGILAICNITGQVLDTKEIFDSGHYEYNPGFSDGIYIITFTAGTRRSSKKLFYQNK